MIHGVHGVGPAPDGATVLGHAAVGVEVKSGFCATKSFLESLPIFDRHQIVQDGVDGGGDVVEDARDVHEILVDGPEDHGLLEVDIAEPLGVEWGPAQEEGDHHDS